MEVIFKNKIVQSLNGGRLTLGQMKQALTGLAVAGFLVVYLMGHVYNLFLVTGAGLAGSQHHKIAPHVSKILAAANKATSNLPVPKVFLVLGAVVVGAGVALRSLHFTLLVWMAGAYRVGFVNSPASDPKTVGKAKENKAKFSAMMKKT